MAAHRQAQMNVLNCTDFILYHLDDDHISHDVVSVLLRCEKERLPYDMYVIASKLIEGYYTQKKIAKWIWYTLSPLILLLGTVGNVLSYCVMRRPTLRSSSTGLYFAALAIADSVVLWVGLFRHWLSETWSYDIRIQSEVTCKLQRTILYVAMNTSVWLLVALTVERFISVLHPVKARIICTLRNSKISLLAICTIMLLFNGHTLFTRGTEVTVDPVTNETRTSVCGFTSDAAKLYWTVVIPWLVPFVYNIGPFVIMIVCNVLIVRRLLELKKRRKAFALINKGLGRIVNSAVAASKHRNINESLSSLTAMFLTVSIVFLVLSFPSLVNLMMDTFGTRLFAQNSLGKAKAELLEAILLMMMYLNHGINFVLYVCTGARFRREFKQLIKPCLRCSCCAKRLKRTTRRERTTQVTRGERTVRVGREESKTKLIQSPRTVVHRPLVRNTNGATQTAGLGRSIRRGITQLVKKKQRCAGDGCDEKEHKRRCHSMTNPTDEGFGGVYIGTTAASEPVRYDRTNSTSRVTNTVAIIHPSCDDSIVEETATEISKLGNFTPPLSPHLKQRTTKKYDAILEETIPNLHFYADHRRTVPRKSSLVKKAGDPGRKSFDATVERVLERANLSRNGSLRYNRRCSSLRAHKKQPVIPQTEDYSQTDSLLPRQQFNSCFDNEKENHEFNGKVLFNKPDSQKHDSNGKVLLDKGDSENDVLSPEWAAIHWDELCDILANQLETTI